MFELYGIAGLTFFSRSFSLIYFKCAAVAAVFGFSSFCLTVFGKRRSFTVCGTICKECATQKLLNIFKSLDKMVNDYDKHDFMTVNLQWNCCCI